MSYYESIIWAFVWYLHLFKGSIRKLRGPMDSKQTAAACLYPIYLYKPWRVSAKQRDHVLFANSRRETGVSAQAL